MFEFFKKLFGTEDMNIELYLKRGAVILDVRTPIEFKKGAPKAAVNIPLSKIEASIDRIKKFRKPIITCCASGRRSGLAADLLRKSGVEAYNGGPWKRVSKIINKNALAVKNS